MSTTTETICQECPERISKMGERGQSSRCKACLDKFKRPIVLQRDQKGWLIPHKKCPRVTR